jgi:hypothetical protein
MKKLLAALISAALMLMPFVLNTAAKSAEDTFILFIEAEDCELDGFAAVDGITGAVGKMILGGSDPDSFTVNFSVPADGTYVLWLKVWHESQSDNSLKYTLDDGIERVFDFDENAGANDDEYFMLRQWYWIAINERGTEPLENGWSEWGEANNQVRHTPVYLDLKKGDNSITFTVREAGHYIDQVIITDDLDYDPGDVPGNETYTCTFCNLEHFRYEPYEKFGKTPEQYFNERLAAEIAAKQPAPAPEPPAETAPVTAAPVAAPQTFDALTLGFALCGAAAVSAVKIARRKR